MTSADAKLCFGIILPEGFKFPFKDDEYGLQDGLDSWCREKQGFRHSKKEPTNKLTEIKSPLSWNNELDFRNDEEFLWDQEHGRLRFTLVNFGSSESSDYVLVLRSSLVQSRFGNPQELDFLKLNELVTQKESMDLIDFCSKKLHFEGRPKWYLLSLLDI